jgi:hypothetical protein
MKFAHQACDAFVASFLPVIVMPCFYVRAASREEHPLSSNEAGEAYED